MWPLRVLPVLFLHRFISSGATGGCVGFFYPVLAVGSSDIGSGFPHLQEGQPRSDRQASLDSVEHFSSDGNLKAALPIYPKLPQVLKHLLTNCCQLSLYLLNIFLSGSNVDFSFFSERINISRNVKIKFISFNLALIS